MSTTPTALDADVHEAISKHLSAQVGEVLRQRLDQADKDAAKVISLQTLADERLGLITQTAKCVDALQAELAKHSTLEAREKAVSDREIRADLNSMQVQLAAAKEQTQFCKDVALGLVRNTEYRKDTWASDTKNVNTSPQQPYATMQSFTDTASSGITEKAL